MRHKSEPSAALRVHHAATKRRNDEKMKRTATRASTVEHLPHDLIVEIVAQVVASSDSPLADLRIVRSTCKSFREAATSRAVARRVPIEKEESLIWWNKERYLDVLKSCASAGNLEASFLLGLHYVFGDGACDDDRGLACLKDAASGGHDAARYALGVLYFGRRDAELRRAGTDYLNGLDGSSHLTSSPYVEGCRRKVTAVVRNIWMKNFDVAPRVACTHRCCGRIVGASAWDQFQQQQFCSQSCMWRDEYHKFFKSL